MKGVDRLSLNGTYILAAFGPVLVHYRDLWAGFGPFVGFQGWISNGPELDPLACFASLFHNQAVFQKMYMILFDQVAIDAKSVLRIPDSYDAKIAKICNFWTSLPVWQLINHLFKI